MCQKCFRVKQKLYWGYVDGFINIEMAKRHEYWMLVCLESHCMESMSWPIFTPRLGLKPKISILGFRFSTENLK